MSGELMAGEALPSLRKLAKELRVSVLTVTRAYNELAMDKLREVSIEAKAADISLLDLLGMFEKAYREQS